MKSKENLLTRASSEIGFEATQQTGDETCSWLKFKTAQHYREGGTIVRIQRSPLNLYANRESQRLDQLPKFHIN